MFTEVQLGLARYLRGFYAFAKPTTASMKEWLGRGVDRAIARGPGRQVDDSDGLLESFRKNDNSGQPGTSASIPALIFAVSRDLTVANDWGRSSFVGDQPIKFPQDEQGRQFRIRYMQGDVRAQIVVFAGDDDTLRSIVYQLQMFISGRYNIGTDVEPFWAGGRTFMCDYKVADFIHKQPCQIETPDFLLANIPTNQKNLVLSSIDITLRVTVPIVFGPGCNEAGEGGVVTDPPTPGSNTQGYPVVHEVNEAGVGHAFAGSQGAVSQVDEASPIVEKREAFSE